MPDGTTDSRKYIKVNDYFQVDNPNYTNIYAIGDVSTFDPIKTYMKIIDQIPTMVKNISATLEGKPLVPHIRGESFEGKILGPVMVSFGHDVSGAKGVGPDMPGCMGWCCFLCCCCQAPHGSCTSKIKAHFNTTIKPTPGKGLSA